VNLLHSSLYTAVLWTGGENSVNNALCFSYCRAVLTQHQSLFCSSRFPTRE